MATSEERIDRLEEKYNNLHTVVSVIAAKVDATNEKVDNLISEMRDRDNRRAAENAEIRNEIREINKSTDAKIDSMSKHIRNLSYTSIAAIAALVLTVLLNLPK